MTLLVWIAYLVAWTPYSVVGLKATLGDPNSVGYFEAAMPAVLAKTATVYNPIIYVAMNEHFKRALLKVRKTRLEVFHESHQVVVIEINVNLR